MMIFLLCLLICLGVSVAMKQGHRFYFSPKGKLDIKSLDIYTSGVLGAALIISCAILSGLYPFICSEYRLFISLCLVLLVLYKTDKKLPNKINFLADFAICAFGVFGLIQPYPHAITGYWLWGIIISFIWLCGWRLFRWFDRYPMMSMVVSTAWIAAVIIATIIVSGYYQPALILAVVLGVVLFMLLRSLSVLNMPRLGTYAASLAGYVWAGVWVASLKVGTITPILMIYSYLILELLPIFFFAWKKMDRVPLLVQAFQVQKQGKHAIRFVCTHVFLLTCLAIMLMFSRLPLNMWVFWVITAVILLDLHQKLTHLESPLGSWKHVCQDIIHGVKALPMATKQLSHDVHQVKVKRRTKKTIKGKKRQ